jgi:hypothetical protein
VSKNILIQTGTHTHVPLAFACLPVNALAGPRPLEHRQGAGAKRETLATSGATRSVRPSPTFPRTPPERMLPIAISPAVGAATHG